MPPQNVPNVLYCSCVKFWGKVFGWHIKPVQDPWDLPPLFPNYLLSVLRPPPWQNIQLKSSRVKSQVDLSLEPVLPHVTHELPPAVFHNTPANIFFIYGADENCQSSFLSCTSCPSPPRSSPPQLHYLLPLEPTGSSCQLYLLNFHPNILVSRNV